MPHFAYLQKDQLEKMTEKDLETEIEKLKNKGIEAIFSVKKPGVDWGSTEIFKSNLGSTNLIMGNEPIRYKYYLEIVPGSIQNAIEALELAEEGLQNFLLENSHFDNLWRNAEQCDLFFDTECFPFQFQISMNGWQMLYKNEVFPYRTKKEFVQNLDQWVAKLQKEQRLHWEVDPPVLMFQSYLTDVSDEAQHKIYEDVRARYSPYEIARWSGLMYMRDLWIQYGTMVQWYVFFDKVYGLVDGELKWILDFEEWRESTNLGISEKWMEKLKNVKEIMNK